MTSSNVMAGGRAVYMSAHFFLSPAFFFFELTEFLPNELSLFEFSLNTKLLLRGSSLRSSWKASLMLVFSLADV